MLRRGQSALEYLVTYGWAILAIVIVAALLWYLGIFNPGNLVGSGNSAKGFTFNVLDQKYNDTTLTMSFGNTVGNTINITSVTVSGAGVTITDRGYSVSTGLAAGRQATMILDSVADCGAAGDAYSDVQVIFTYDNLATGITGKTDSGTLAGRCA
ncbi:hypothetical protein HUU53_01005 [Candidatus Micrarchaeota archaeon]|nr:hypothetical protein [Candidatus Micrarchaeota archaeon]